MTLYRMCYLRDGRPTGQTFAAATPQLACRVVETFEETSGISVLTLKRLGQSRFSPSEKMRAYLRVRNELHREGEWPWPTSRCFITFIVPTQQELI